MPSLVWSSVLLVVLLQPGLFFYLGLYAPERFSRDTAPKNPLSTLGIVVLVSLLAHALADYVVSLAGFRVAWDQILDAIHMTGAVKPIVGRRVAQYYWDAKGGVPLYVAVTAGIGYFAGWVAGWASVRGYIPGAVQFPWAYDLRQVEHGAEQITYAHVLSNVEHAGKALLYRGRLQHFGLNSDGTFAYIALGATEQRFLDLTRGDPVVRDRTPIGGTLGAPETLDPRFRDRVAARFRGRKAQRRTRVVGGALMMISSSNIRSVVFQAEYKMDLDKVAQEMAANPDVQTELESEMPVLPDGAVDELSDQVELLAEDEEPAHAAAGVAGSRP